MKKEKKKTASKIVKEAEKKEKFNKDNSDELNKAHGERIKNNVEDGEDTFGV